MVSGKQNEIRQNKLRCLYQTLKRCSKKEECFCFNQNACETKYFKKWSMTRSRTWRYWISPWWKGSWAQGGLPSQVLYIIFKKGIQYFRYLVWNPVGTLVSWRKTSSIKFSWDWVLYWDNMTGNLQQSQNKKNKKTPTEARSGTNNNSSQTQTVSATQVIYYLVTCQFGLSLDVIPPPPHQSHQHFVAAEFIQAPEDGKYIPHVPRSLVSCPWAPS